VSLSPSPTWSRRGPACYISCGVRVLAQEIRILLWSYSLIEPPLQKQQQVFPDTRGFVWSAWSSLFGLSASLRETLGDVSGSLWICVECVIEFLRLECVAWNSQSSFSSDRGSPRVEENI